MANQTEYMKGLTDAEALYERTGCTQETFMFLSIYENSQTNKRGEALTEQYRQGFTDYVYQTREKTQGFK